MVRLRRSSISNPPGSVQVSACWCLNTVMNERGDVMKIQLVSLLLVVLLASLPSVVFPRPPLQSGETSQTAKATEIVQKSWKGPFYGLGIGLGGSMAKATGLPWSDLVAAIPVQFRLGYGISDSTVLYGSILGLRFTQYTSEWAPPMLLLGMMWRGQRGGDSYGFISGGVTADMGPHESSGAVTGSKSIPVSLRKLQPRSSTLTMRVCLARLL